MLRHSFLIKSPQNIEIYTAIFPISPASLLISHVKLINPLMRTPQKQHNLIMLSSTQGYLTDATNVYLHKVVQVRRLGRQACIGQIQKSAAIHGGDTVPLLVYNALKKKYFGY
jgi:hypothetical protein